MKISPDDLYELSEKVIRITDATGRFLVKETEDPAVIASVLVSLIVSFMLAKDYSDDEMKDILAGIYQGYNRVKEEGESGS